MMEKLLILDYKTRFWQFSDEEESLRSPYKLRQTLSGSPKATTLADVCSLVSLSKKPHSNVSFSIFKCKTVVKDTGNVLF